jgi:protein-tyrosine phosphatase
LFLCTGNICRSPYAEKVFGRYLPDSARNEVEVFSAGFIGPNRPSPPEAVSTAASRSTYLDDHRSKTVDRDLLSRSEHVVAMEAVHLRNLQGVRVERFPPAILLGDLDPETPDRREIQDPWGRPLSAFESSFVRIERCLEELARLAYSAPTTPGNPPGDSSAASE